MNFLFADGLFWASVACCVVAQFFIVRSILRTHHVPGPGASPMPIRRGGLELLWAVVPAVALAVLLFYTWRAVQHNAPRSLSPPSSRPAAELPA
jgi:heme/copper-type cytochrome/quinol oxidase subunit 2